MCYCGANKSFKDCCEPFILERLTATTAEQLMRSRFSAFYTKHTEWLKHSWDETTQPQSISFEDKLKWLDLSILNTTDVDALNSTVEFEARYLKDGKVQAIHENSRFINREGNWFYVNGDYLKTTFKPFKVSRNDACPCGSERKFKNCCSAS